MSLIDFFANVEVTGYEVEGIELDGQLMNIFDEYT